MNWRRLAFVVAVLSLSAAAWLALAHFSSTVIDSTGKTYDPKKADTQAKKCRVELKNAKELPASCALQLPVAVTYGWPAKINNFQRPDRVGQTHLVKKIVWPAIVIDLIIVLLPATLLLWPVFYLRRKNS